MNLSNTAQYAIRVVSYMARKNEGLYTAAMLIDELKVSDKYLKRILTTLTRSGIVESVQGRYGGFRLKMPVQEIPLLSIVRSVENVEKYFGCVLGFEQCSDHHPCPVHEHWKPLRERIFAFLSKTTMADVMANDNILRF